MRSSTKLLALGATGVVLAALLIQGNIETLPAGDAQSTVRTTVRAAEESATRPAPRASGEWVPPEDVPREVAAAAEAAARAKDSTTTSTLRDEATSEALASITDPKPERTHYYNGQDPNQQPRDVFHEGFAGMNRLPTGYEATGDFVLSPDGLTIKGATAGEDGKPRMAMIESPAIPLKFQSNAVNPLWKEVSPEGTEVLVEVSLSEDGQTWTDWMPTTSGHYEGDMSPTYPDGRPNPNYGYTLGDMTFYGLKRFQYFRYAMTLYSDTNKSPLVSDFRLFYQDSTMGDTEVANATQPEQPGQAEATP